jgi:hypothetical protein
VVIDSDRQLFLGLFLANYILVEKGLHFHRPGKPGLHAGHTLSVVLFKDRIADSNTLVADVSPRMLSRRGNQLAYCILGLLAE